MSSETKIKTFKAFNKDWTYRGFQYKIGETSVHEGEVKACDTGFHSCQYPLDIFNYCNPCSSVFAEVESSGVISKEDKGFKVVPECITLKRELNLPELVASAIEYTKLNCIGGLGSHTTGDQAASSATGAQAASSATGAQAASSATGDQAASSATGYQAASSATGARAASSATGDQAASSATGNRAASSATGNRTASSATGDQAASSATGYRAASSATGDQAASSATGGQAASSATGARAASSATGDRAASSATGYQAASSATGNQAASLVTGVYGASETTNETNEPIYASAIATGYCGKVKGTIGDALFLVERNLKGEIIAVWSGIVGKKRIKPNTWYTLKAGKPTIVEKKDE